MDTKEPISDKGLSSFQDSISYAVREQLLVLDPDLRVQAASSSFYTAFQVAPAETVGKKLAKLGNGQWDIPALLSQLRDLPELDGELNDLEVEHDFPALGPRTMLVSARRLSAESNKIGMILLSIRDTTGQKLIEAEFGLLHTRFHTTLASIGDAVIVTDPESRVTFMNPAAEKLTGWQGNDAFQKHLSEIFNIVNERSSMIVENPVTRVIREGAVIGLASHTILIARDGSEWPIDDSAAPIIDNGRLVGVVLVFHDVSNRRKAEQDLQISEVRYRRLFEAAHDGILLIDAVTMKVLEVNPFLANLLGYPKEHFLGKELWEIGVFEDAEVSKQAMATLQRLGEIRYENLPLLHRDGRPIPVEFVSNVYREGRQNVIQCNIRDITDRRHLTDDLAKARLDAESANRSKSEFLANMSHEIRTPMSAILGFAQMLLDKSPEECSQIGCVQIIQRNSLHLLELINEILDLSKVEAGQMKVESIPCDFPALLSEIISLMRPRAAEKGLAFGITFDGPIPRLIQSDPLRLRQILVNLLGNAVKFTETGRIDLRITGKESTTDSIALRIEVSDTGIGMSPEQCERLFQPFTQADASITRKFQGTGLGLTISRQLANLLGGDVTAAPRAEGGSNFTVTVKGGPSAGVELLQDLTEATLPSNLDQSARANIHLRGRILLVEDGADNQRLLRMQLSDAGASVTSALDGQVAIDLAVTQRFDLILMDMQMPIMDGYAATTELRRRGLTTPIIALTAYAMADDRDKCLASGCTSYLSKPIAEETLLRSVFEHLGNSHSSLSEDIAKPTAVETAILSADPDTSKPIKSSFANDSRIMQVVPEFVDGLPDKVHKMQEFLAHGDLASLERIAHQLLGACGGYGFDAATQPAINLEQSIKAGKDLTFIASRTQSLIEVLCRIEGYEESKAPLAVGACAK